jgi:hypothetical protein
MSGDRYRPVQQRIDSDTSEFVLSGEPKYMKDAIYAQHVARSGDIVPFTLMAIDSASLKWRTFIDETAANGTAIPQGIYVGPTIAEADIQAGDIENLLILRRDAQFREDWLVIENGKTLNTLITVGTTDIRTVRDRLLDLNLIPRTMDNYSRVENA